MRRSRSWLDVKEDTVCDMYERASELLKEFVIYMFKITTIFHRTAAQPFHAYSFVKEMQPREEGQ